MPDLHGGHPDAGLVEMFRGIRRDARQPDGSTATAVMAAIPFIIDGGGAVIANGSAGGVTVPFPCRIKRVELQEFEGTSGSITVDIQKAPPGAAPAFASICAATRPSIASSRYSIDTTLAGWTTTINRYDALKFIVSGIASFTRITVVLHVRRLDLTG